MSTPSKQNHVNVNVDKVVITGGHDKPPKKKKDDDNSIIPLNESDVSGLDYITEG